MQCILGQCRADRKSSYSFVPYPFFSNSWIRDNSLKMYKKYSHAVYIKEKWVIRKCMKKTKKHSFPSISLVDMIFFSYDLRQFNFPLFYPNILKGQIVCWSVQRTITIISYSFCFRKGEMLSHSLQQTYYTILLFTPICKMYRLLLSISDISYKNQNFNFSHDEHNTNAQKEILITMNLLQCGSFVFSIFSHILKRNLFYYQFLSEGIIP